MIGFFALLLRFVPFAGPIGIILGFLPRLLHLKREKAVIAAATQAGIPTEPFPVANQIEIDNHTIRVRMAAWRLAAGVMTATTAGLGFLWYGATAKIEEVTAQRDEKERMRALAVEERDKHYVSYVNAEKEVQSLRARVSEDSIKRQGLIAVDVKKRTAARKGRLDVEKKLPASSIDPAEWMRVESAQGGDAATPAPAVSDPGSVPTGAG